MRALAFALLLCLLVAPGRAAAQDLDERNREPARRLATQASAAFERRDYRRAQALLEDAYRLYPSPKLQYSLGRIYEAQGKGAAAATAYQLFLQRVPAAERVPGQAEEVGAALRRLTRRLSRLQVRGPGGAWFLVDGGERRVLPVDEIWVEPGNHRVTCAGGDLNVEVRAGGQAAVYLLPAPAPSAPAPVSLTTSAAPAGRPGPLRGLKWAALSVGVAGVVVGSVLIGVHGQPRCDLHSRELQCPELLSSRDAGIGVLTTGAALVVGAGILFWLDHRSGKVRP
jgi:hypothetical protein